MKTTKTTKTMKTTIDLSKPVRTERVRWFQPPWRTVFVYRCAMGHEQRVFASSFSGSRPVPSVGGINCAQCEALPEVTS